MFIGCLHFKYKDQREQKTTVEEKTVGLGGGGAGNGVCVIYWGLFSEGEGGVAGRFGRRKFPHA